MQASKPRNGINSVTPQSNSLPHVLNLTTISNPPCISTNSFACKRIQPKTTSVLTQHLTSINTPLTSEANHQTTQQLKSSEIIIFFIFVFLNKLGFLSQKLELRFWAVAGLSTKV
jgi:hypothetical protein